MLEIDENMMAEMKNYICKFIKKLVRTEEKNQ